MYNHARESIASEKTLSHLSKDGGHYLYMRNTIFSTFDTWFSEWGFTIHIYDCPWDSFDSTLFSYVRMTLHILPLIAVWYTYTPWCFSTLRIFSYILKVHWYSNTYICWDILPIFKLFTTSINCEHPLLLKYLQ